MAIKNYMINDKWLDLDKQNIVELQSVDGELDSLKVNGSEIVTPSGKITITENGTDIDIAQYALADVNVEGGGGSSDFSTAEVTVSTTVEDVIIVRGCITVEEEGFIAAVPNFSVDAETPNTVNFILYKGTAFATIENGDFYNIVTTGDIENDDGDIYITGSGSITISPIS